MTGETWTREEQLLAFNLYCKLPFGQYHHRNPYIIKLAEALGRTPGAVAMKLGNFASLDPYHQKRGVKGLSHTSNADKAIWDEFQNDWNKAAIESESLFEKIVPYAPSDITDSAKADPSRATETERSVTVRLGQS